MIKPEHYVPLPKDYKYKEICDCKRTLNYFIMELIDGKLVWVEKEGYTNDYIDCGKCYK